jgi:hypothetical protein
MEHTIEDNRGETLMSFTPKVDTRTAYAVLDTLERSGAINRSYLELSKQYSDMRVMLDTVITELNEVKAKIQ